MQDSIGNFERIRELYISYLDTAFRIRDPSVSDERRRLLRTPGSLCTEPLVEPLPRYEWDGSDGNYRSFDDIYRNRGDNPPLADLSEPGRKAFVELVLAGLFPSNERTDGSGLRRKEMFPPYKHQVEMLARGVKECTPGVVTSGTGSGKTEAFLLPLLARIAEEATSWEAPDQDYLRRRWWHDESGRPYTKTDRKGRTVVSYSAIPQSLRPLKSDPTRSPFQRHRAGESRPAAMRALILYPMNALVEDQLVRLRKALDSLEARLVMDAHFKGNRIFFGRYTGATPTTGHHLHPGLRSLLEASADDLNGDILFPDHKRAGADGRVTLANIRQTELERRQRNLSKLFDHVVGLERGQLQARLHALDHRAAVRLRRSLGEPTGQTVGAESFLESAARAGKRGWDGLLHDYRTYVGVDPNERQAQALQDVTLKGVDAASAPTAFGDSAPFMFPSIDGSEMTNRWDMQEDPPDLLITNVSMLSAMLNREVEASIFEKTREWLQQPNSYFYLVLDELHLQRGASGTEVSYLIRLLLERLGLTQSPEQRRKIRVLASSASLPASLDDEARESAKYLCDMFGPFGIDPDEAADSERTEALWLSSIVAGHERVGKYQSKAPGRLDPSPFISFLEVHTPATTLELDLPRAAPLFARPLDGEQAVTDAWLAVADALGVPEGSFDDRVRASIADAAERVAWACSEDDKKKPGSLRSRALPTSELAVKLFDWGSSTSSYEDQLEAVRGILFVRGCGDGLDGLLAGDADPIPSFRLHTFFRSIEGLYAPATRSLGSPETEAKRDVHIGQLSIDQRSRISLPAATGNEEHRLFEVLYCECCGELLLGGMRADIGRRSGYLAELLPQEPNLEGLPDQSISQRFEELSWNHYGIFWPGSWQFDDLDHNTDDRDKGRWLRVYLERQTGGIIRSDKVGNAADVLLPGWYYDRSDRGDSHRRRNDDAGDKRTVRVSELWNILLRP